MSSASCKGTLVLVGTPIGNRGDLSPRARKAIVSADLLLCEDTRSPLRLLGETGDALPPRVSCFVGNEHDRVQLLRDALMEGKRVAYVSEAGMPVWSDPGRFLVEAAWSCGAQLDCIPGPTASGMALALSGFAAEGATFFGFIERAGPQRKAQLEGIAAASEASIIYEAGNRTRTLLCDLATVLGDEAAKRRVMIGRELTKAHQELVRASVDECAEQTNAALRGEVVVVLEGRGAAHERDDDDPKVQGARAALEILTDEGLKPRARAKKLAQLTGLDSSELYRRLQRK